MAGSRSRSTARSSRCCVKPLGGYMTQVFTGERTFLSPVLRPVERGIYWLCGVDEKQEQHWVTYARRDAALQPRRLRVALCAAAACRPCCRSIRRACRRSSETSPSTPRSASSPTPTGSPTCRETTMSYLVADGRADGAQFRLGGDRHRAGDRADPRLRAALGAERSAISGSI